MDGTAVARAYDLWAHLILDGPIAEVQLAVRQLPALAALLPDVDLDELAAAHLRAMTLDVQPWESVFLGETGLLGGPVAEQVRLAAAGHLPPSRGMEPDHLGVELAVLARMPAGRAAAFLDEHLLRWLPPLVLAVRSNGDPFWTAVVEMALELAASHRGMLPGEMASFTLPELPPLLDDPKTGLKRLADTWTRPALAGIFLTKRQISRSAATAGVPGGFGGRFDQLEAALYTAIDHGKLPALLEALDLVLVEAVGSYRDLGHLGVVVQPWIERVEQTRLTVRRVRDAAA